jgi:hypothetical protein
MANRPAGEDVPHARPGAGQPRVHGDLDQEPEPVAAMRPAAPAGLHVCPNPLLIVLRRVMIG